MGERGPDGFGEESHTERSKCGERVPGSSLMFGVPLSYLIPSLQVAPLTCSLFLPRSPQTLQTPQTCHVALLSPPFLIPDICYQICGAITHGQGHMCLLR